MSQKHYLYFMKNHVASLISMLRMHHLELKKEDLNNKFKWIRSLQKYF